MNTSAQAAMSGSFQAGAGYSIRGGSRDVVVAKLAVGTAGASVVGAQTMVGAAQFDI